MTIISKTFLVISTLLVTSFTVAYFSSDLFRFWNEPSDEYLKTIFVKQQDSFQKLERLFLDDPDLYFVSSSKSHRNNGRGVESSSITTDELRDIFDQTGILFGTRDGTIDLKFIALPVFRKHLNYGDFSEQFYEEKGFALILGSDEKLQEIIGSGRSYGGVEFKQIEKHWYIYNRVEVSKPE